MLQGHPRTSSSSHNFLGVREIASSAYPTRAKFAGNTEDCAVAAAATKRAFRIRVSDSNLWAQVAALSFVDRARASRRKYVQRAARERSPDRTLISIGALLTPTRRK